MWEADLFLCGYVTMNYEFHLGYNFVSQLSLNSVTFISVIRGSVIN